jgi:transcriptional regulator with XRE-family HTH domain
MSQQDRVMTPRQFKNAIKELGLTQAAAGRYLDVSERTANRYAKGTARIPAPSAILLRLLIQYGIKPFIPKWISPLEGRRD